MHPVPLDGTDGKVANEPSRVRVSVVEPSGTWTFGLGKNRDVFTVMMRCENRVPRVATKTRLRLCPRGGARTPSVAERTWLLPCEATNAVGAFQQQSDAARARGRAQPRA